MDFWQYILGQVATVVIAFGGSILAFKLQKSKEKGDKSDDILENSRILTREVLMYSNNLAVTSMQYYKSEIEELYCQINSHTTAFRAEAVRIFANRVNVLRGGK